MGKFWSWFKGRSRKSQILLSVAALFIVFALIGSLSDPPKEEKKAEATPVAEKKVEEPPKTTAPVAVTQTTPPPPPPKQLTPQENLAQSSKVVLKDRFRSAEIGAAGEAIIQFASNENAWDARKDVCEDSVKTAKQIYANEGSINNLIFRPFGATKDVYGNENESQIMVIHISRATSDKINPDGVDYDQCRQFVDFYDELVRFD